MNGYKTVKEYAFDEFIERKSRFIGHIAPVSTQDEAISLIQKISKDHRCATHNVYAYTLKEGQVSRCSDNGEPQGTAGVPVLDVLLKEEIVNVCVVVTRYFGGILLGAGGLVRAYSHAAKLALDAAQIVHMSLCAEVSLNCDYSFYSKLSSVFHDYRVKVNKSNFGEKVSLSIFIRADRFNQFVKSITELSNGQVHPHKILEFFGDMK